jgi:hypothetical protein
MIFFLLTIWFLREGAPVIQSLAERLEKPNQELFLSEVELEFFQTR